MGKAKRECSKMSKQSLDKVIGCLDDFIQRVYDEAGLKIPDEFYSKKEASRIVDTLTAKGMGIDISREKS